MIIETDEKACAKLNISLDVTERRDDGYHNMVMVMQSVSLADDVHIVLNDTGKVFAKTNFRFIPTDERNLAVKAALRFFKAVGDTEHGASITVVKHIPVGSGMGGGSSDAAAVLRAMNRMFDAPFTTEELADMGADVGSDVPFCVMGGTALAKGRGEILTPLRPLPECTFVICKPRFSVSTPELFKQLDRVPNKHHPDTAGILYALEAGDLYSVCRRMFNVFETVEDRRMRPVGEIKSILLDKGAIGAIMTGTGSAVFGVFDDREKAESTVEGLKKEFGFCCTAHAV
ncbi:MAG: 4-(cytidine 5'-diphospho)-2-C-methyl-D-erythritol kinase [Eubacteriales bacterium]|nr:4-(cytidine 5'-diphospho)-2-C-methyl-D-erythritol kinase [Eubacteriales bacterium]